MAELTSYVGRFAPTPSGPLHFGSIVTALASYLEARTNRGIWLLRMDDLDAPRVRAGAGDDIIRALEKLGFTWDSGIVYQSTRHSAYEDALDALSQRNLLYRCYCSRKQTRSLPYPGTCRNRRTLPNRQFAVRLRTPQTPVSFTDTVQGIYSQQIRQQSGDFILRRADRQFAYHLAVAVDDAWQGVTHVVRGADLLDSTPKQIYLQKQLRLPRPVYSHVPVATDANGMKISKRHGALAALLQSRPSAVLVDALHYLGQAVEPGLAASPPDQLLDAALANWNIAHVPRVREIILPVTTRADEGV